MKPYYYVYRVGNGNSNVKHSTVESAQKEAERICNQHPGTTFEILKCIASVRCTQASTFWMDGEGPSEKPNYRAMEEGEEFSEGDEYLVCGKWTAVPSCSFGSRYDERYKIAPHRRPL